MSNKNLLVELFVEELPPKVLKKLGEAFANSLHQGLVLRRFVEESAQPISYATPRRLAALIPNVLPTARDELISKRLMPTAVAFDSDNKPTPALVKALKKMFHDEIDIEKMLSSSDFVKKIDDGKEYLYYEAMATGGFLGIGLEGALNDAIEQLPIPKVMSYQLADGWDTVSFVRPAHGLLVLHGTEALTIRALGLESGKKLTKGHRFQGSPLPIEITSADSYEKQLNDEGKVIASFEVRKKEIEHQLNIAAAKENLKPIDDDALLDEVTALVERPNVLLGQFEPEYLEVPQECLILTMKANQKYFPLLDANGKLTNKFLIVSNINPADPSAVIQGNERVVRPRLADAKFFFDQDRKKTLESRIAGLDKVVYHNKLGSQGERNARVVKITSEIAKQIGDASLVAKVELAARLSKTDLVTDMVGEFPELQGIMGRYYAQHEKLDNDVAFAIEDHYKPRFAGDELPRNQVGICVALADKLETLVGLFSIGEKPTGDKDPFALRRQALGIIRMLIDAKLPISFDALVQIAFKQFTGDAASISAVKEFCFDRLSVNLRDQGASPQEVDAVLSHAPDFLSEIPKHLEAVRVFTTLPEAPALAAANKRVGNILKKVESAVNAEVNANLLQEPAEKALTAALANVKPKADKAFEAGDYTASLQALAALKTPVDDFFDNVMVNADDVDLKNNRLALLNQLHQAMNRVADLSKLAS